MSITFTEAVDTLYTHTLTNQKKEMVDNIFDATPFYHQLKSKGGIVKWTGGRYLDIPVVKGKNPTGAWLDEDGTVSLEDFDPDTMVRYPWGYYAINITRKWMNDQRNSGKAAIRNAIESKVKTTKLSMIDDFEESLFTAQSGLAMYGLPDAVYHTGTSGKSTNTYPSGYDRGTETWWGNHYKATSTPSSVNIINDTTNLFNTISEGKFMFEPTMMITTQTGFELYQREMEEKFRIVNQLKTGDVKFRNIEFLGCPIHFSPQCPSGRNYLLNLDNMYLMIDPNYDFTPTPWKERVNQPNTRAQQLCCTLNLVTERSRGLGVLTGITE